MDNLRISGLMNSMVYAMQPPQPPRFENIDANQDGSINKTEFQSSLKDLPHPGPAPDVDELFSAIDTDQNGLINQPEMQAAGERFQANMDGMRPAGGPPPGGPPPEGAPAGGPPAGGAPGAGAPPVTGTEEEEDAGVSYDPLDTNKDGVVDMNEMIAAGLMGPSQEFQYGTYSLPTGNNQTGNNLIDLFA